MNTVNSRRKYDRQFKLEAVRLVTQGGRPVVEVARDLGIHENLLYNWRRKYLDDTIHAFPGKGHLKPADEEMRRLLTVSTSLCLTVYINVAYFRL